MERFFFSKRYLYFIAGILVFLGLYLASLYSYLLFHSLAEIFSIVVAYGIFMVAWNSRRFLDNHYFLFIGIAYLFVGGLDLIHTLAYKGMGVFEGYETNLPTQLWIAARYMGSLSLLLAPFFLRRRLKINYVFLGYALVTFLLLMSIFYWNIFPICFIEGVGLTPFKKISEYIISLILLASIALLLKHRREFDRTVLQWVVWSIMASIASELAFTFYTDPYGFFNLVGHFLKILSFYFIYKAIIVMGLTKPYDLLFRNLKQMEEALRKSRDELEIRVQDRTKEVREQSRVLDSFFKYSITPFVILDKDFNFIRVNEAYAKACQREVSEFPGHNHFEFYPSDARQIFEQVVKTREPYHAIARPFTFPDHPEWGTSYWDWILTPLLNDTGETEFLVFSLEDVTKRKRAEEALKAERQRFNNVLEILPAYLVLLTPDYHVPFANRFFRKRFGESHGKRCFEYLFGRSESCEICETYTVLKTMAPHEWEWTGPDGHIYDVFDFPFTDTDGSPLILEMGIDITERKRAEQALHDVSLYNRGLIEASLDPLVTISANGKIMDVNSATELVIGVPRNQLIGSDFSDYFTEPEKARKGYQNVFAQGSVRDYPLAIRHTSGMITDVLYNATVYRNGTGEIQGIFAAARDVTDMKRAEEALRESETRLRALSSQLLTAQEGERKRIAMELHDGIGQILTAIKFKVENILQEKGKGKARAKEKSLETIIPLVIESVEEVRRIQMDLRPSTLDDLGILATLGWFCREFQKIYFHIRIEKEIGLQESEVSTPLKTVIYRLTQEALNNIAKHSKADLIHLSLRKIEDRVEWVVKDNGIGFDLEEILSSERSKRGLGLNSMRERTELSGGSFEIETTLGAGTMIRASWPL